MDGRRPVRVKRGGELEGVNLLLVAPVRTARWEEHGERVVVERPRPVSRGVTRLLEFVSYLTATKRIRLDEIGSFAWRRLDGTTTVADVAAALRHEFGEAVEPAEERLGRLVRMLRREGLLAYPGWDPPVEPVAGGGAREAGPQGGS